MPRWENALSHMTGADAKCPTLCSLSHHRLTRTPNGSPGTPTVSPFISLRIGSCDVAQTFLHSNCSTRFETGLQAFRTPHCREDSSAQARLGTNFRLNGTRQRRSCTLRAWTKEPVVKDRAFATPLEINGYITGTAGIGGDTQITVALPTIQHEESPDTLFLSLPVDIQRHPILRFHAALRLFTRSRCDLERYRVEPAYLDSFQERLQKPPVPHSIRWSTTSQHHAFQQRAFSPRPPPPPHLASGHRVRCTGSNRRASRSG